MNAFAPEQIAVALRAWSKGILSDMAAVHILTSHHTLVSRSDILPPHLQWDDEHTLCRPDWDALRAAIDSPDGPYLSGSARTMLLVAISFGHSQYPMDLGSLPGLDHDNTRLVLEAVCITTGHFPADYPESLTIAANDGPFAPGVLPS